MMESTSDESVSVPLSTVKILYYYTLAKTIFCNVLKGFCINADVPSCYTAGTDAKLRRLCTVGSIPWSLRKVFSESASPRLSLSAKEASFRCKVDESFAVCINAASPRIDVSYLSAPMLFPGSACARLGISGSTGDGITFCGQLASTVLAFTVIPVGQLTSLLVSSILINNSVAISARRDVFFASSLEWDCSDALLFSLSFEKRAKLLEINDSYNTLFPKQSSWVFSSVFASQLGSGNLLFNNEQRSISTFVTRPLTGFIRRHSFAYTHPGINKSGDELTAEIAIQRNFNRTVTPTFGAMCHFSKRLSILRSLGLYWTVNESLLGSASARVSPECLVTLFVDFDDSVLPRLGFEFVFN